MLNKKRWERPSHAARRLARGFFVLLACSGLSVVGCDTKDAAKCDQAVGAVKTAVKAEDFALTGQWRDYAYKHCEDQATLSSLDQEIVSAQNAAKQRQETERVAQQKTKQLFDVFTTWVAGNRAAPQNASRTPVCDKPLDETQPVKAGQQSTERWCKGVRALTSGDELVVRYWEAEPSAAFFSFRAERPVTCQELGPHSVIRAWDVPATGGRSAKRTHCELSGGPLAGLQALVSDAQRADVQVFTPQYLQREAGLRSHVEGR
jgi:hypothetical protein